jgi:hypothetical protein
MIIFWLNHIWHVQILTKSFSKFVPHAWPAFLILSKHHRVSIDECFGGGKINTFMFDDLRQYSVQDYHANYATFKFNSYILTVDANMLDTSENSYLIANLPLDTLLPHLSIANMRVVAASHNIFLHSKLHHKEIQSTILGHACTVCPSYVTVFEPIDTERKSQEKRFSNLKAVQKYQSQNQVKYQRTHLLAVQKNHVNYPEKWGKNNCLAVRKHRQKKIAEFPPCPPCPQLQQKIISDFCHDISPNEFMESGCAACGKLTPMNQLQKFSTLNLNVLKQEGVTQKERFSMHDPIQDLSCNRPVLIETLDKMCIECYESVSNGKCPPLALANGLWIGNIPAELSDLSYAEQLLIARVRHNRCIVRVSSGMHKMRANAVIFTNPTPKIYNVLPPSVDELDDILAFIYTGPCKPTKSDFERTPLLVEEIK